MFNVQGSVRATNIEASVSKIGLGLPFCSSRVPLLHEESFNFGIGNDFSHGNEKESLHI